MESKGDMDIRSKCTLCKTMNCCPEHCCDWDSCKCSDCEYCRGNKEKHEMQLNQDPLILVKSTGQEEVTKIGGKKKKDKKQQQLEEIKPQEQIKLHDGSLITNFEVQQEDDQDIVYAGGLKGIRALKQQRELLQDLPSQVDKEEAKQPYNKSEENKR